MSAQVRHPWEWVRPEVAKIKAYEAEPAGPTVRLDANESPYDVPLVLKQAMLQSFQTQAWNRYPDPDSLALRQALAKWEGVTPAKILVGNGSDEIIRDLFAAFAGPNTAVVLPTPTFSMYGLLATIAGSHKIEIPLQADWSLDGEGMIAALAQPAARILFLANPNNPTGAGYSRQAVESILQATDRLVVVDEAYRLFSGESVVDLVGRYPHLLVLNTFSKAMSLAGLRIGYLVAAPELIEILNRVRLPFNLDRFAQTAAVTALQYPALWREQAQEVVRERERVASGLQSVAGITVFPSQANFLLIRASEALRWKTMLAQAGIAVRGFGSTPRLEDCLRISIGQPQENDRLLACMQGR